MAKTKKTKTIKRTSDGMRQEYDISGGVRGKYYEWYRARNPLVVTLSAKVAKVFPTSEAVNAVLEPIADAVAAGKRGTSARRDSRPRRKAG